MSGWNYNRWKWHKRTFKQREWHEPRAGEIWEAFVGWPGALLGGHSRTLGLEGVTGDAAE